MKKLLLIPSALLLALFLILTSQSATAGSATWNLNPSTGDWNTAGNWTPATVPNSSSDIATFSTSETVAVSLSADTNLNGIMFQPGASSFTITASPLSALVFSGAGILNNSGGWQNFIVGANDAGETGAFVFIGKSGAGTLTTFTTVAGFGSEIQFQQSSTADQATINNAGGTQAANSFGFTGFYDRAIAQSSIINNAGGQISGAAGGWTYFSSTSDAQNAVITCTGSTANGGFGGLLQFVDSAHAGAAILIATGGSNGGIGGTIQFFDHSQGGTARVELFGDGSLDLSVFDGDITIGSLEGDGRVLLGVGSLAIGSSSLSTTFSGTIEDFGGGALMKIGTATLTLGGASLYSGGTTVSAGTLVVSNKSGSATGTGAIQVNGGTLGGSGIISGAVTVNSGAFLAPAHGTKTQSTLTIQSALTFNSGSTYTYTFKAKGKQAKTDKVIANGVTINSGANVTIQGTTKGSLKAGTAYTLISNTSANPISGTFSNLADGAIVNVNGNDLQASYEGGDGNDLSLTVVP